MHICISMTQTKFQKQVLQKKKRGASTIPIRLSADRKLLILTGLAVKL
jgi:hypothetical protein